MSARKPAGAPRIKRELQPREQPVQGNVYFLQLPIPSRSDLELITHAVELRVLRWLKRRGLLRASSDDARNEVTDRSALDACLEGSLGVGQLVALGGADPDQTDDGQVPAERALSVSVAHRAKGSRGFDIHPAVAVPAADRDGRERLLRYCARAPLSLERLRRLCALIPPPPPPPRCATSPRG